MDRKRVTYLRELEGRMAAVMDALLAERRPDRYTVITTAPNGEELEHPDMGWIDAVGDTVAARFREELDDLTREELVVLHGFRLRREGVHPDDIPSRLQAEFDTLGVEVLIQEGAP
jgi:hypothetical protein